MLTPSAAQPADKGLIDEFLTQLFCNFLNVSRKEISKEESFFSLGLTSLIHAEIHASLQSIFGELSSTVLFEYPNVATLRDYLVERRVSREALNEVLTNIESES